MNQPDDDLICVGHILGAQGVKGWVKIFSNTSPRVNIVSYSPWLVEWGTGLRKLGVEGRLQGKHVIARLEGVEDRTQADELFGRQLYIKQDQLPRLDEGEYYWSDLIGLAVVSLQGESLGKVVSMMETGATDVMLVNGERERLIPFAMGDIVTEVDLENQRMVVDWLPEY
jgi:16S rRNA processing protein RimM